MNLLVRLALLALFLALVLPLFACGNEQLDGVTQATPPSGASEDAGATREFAPAEPGLEDGVQVVNVAVGSDNFDPSRIRLAAGTPVRLLFTRTSDETCATQIKLPAFDIGPVDLPLNETVTVEFTPTEAGDFAFVCGMDMQEGALMVRS